MKCIFLHQLHYGCSKLEIIFYNINVLNYYAETPREALASQLDAIIHGYTPNTKVTSAS